MADLELFIENDNLLTLNHLKEAITDQYLNSAAVEATLVDHNGDEVEGQTWPLSLGYVTASDGKYQGIIEDAVELAQADYTVIVTVDAGIDRIAKWRLPVRAVRRTA